MKPKKPVSPWMLRLRLALRILLALIILLPIWFSWSGYMKWQQTRRELIARGEKLSLPDFIPPPVPDDQNFFNDPAWKELADLVVVKSADGSTSMQPRLPAARRQLAELNQPLTKDEIEAVKILFPGIVQSPPLDRLNVASQIINKYVISGPGQNRKPAAALVLKLLSPCGRMIDHISELAKRPFARYPLRYQDSCFIVPTPHLSYILQSAKIPGFRAKAYLVLGNPDAALRDVMLVLRLSDTIDTEPYIISMLVRASIIEIALGDTNAGIELHQWSTEDLKVFESALEKFRLPQDYVFSLRGERGKTNDWLEKLAQGNFDALSSEEAAQYKHNFPMMLFLRGYAPTTRRFIITLSSMRLIISRSFPAAGYFLMTGSMKPRF